MKNEPFLKRLKRSIIDFKGVFKKSEEYEGIAISGDREFIEKTKLVLDLLKGKSPNVLHLIKENIKDIIMGSYSRVYVDIASCMIGNVYKESLIIYASTLAHEAYHVELYRKFKESNPKINKVPSEVYSGENGEKKALEYKIEVLKQLGADVKIIEACHKMYDIKWWEEPHDIQSW